VAVPKRRKSSSKRDKRRAQHDKIAAVNVIECENCGEVTLPHRICAACGHYKGQLRVAVAAPKAAS
jgi:large subunit ribosomal protein L32